MNPLALAGPQFLVFYIGICGTTLFVLSSIIQANEAQGVIPKLTFSDPYEIAMLRGGEKEALRVALFSLIDRGLIMVSGECLQSKAKAVDSARRQIEKILLGKLSAPREAYRVFSEKEFLAGCHEYKISLANLGLLANNKHLERRMSFILMGAAVVLGLAGIKISMAIEREKPFGFLAILAALFSFLLYRIYKRERTGLGDKMVNDLTTLFKGLRERRATIKPGGETNEAALLAAVFGITAVYQKNFPFIKDLFPKAPSQKGNSFFDSGSSCGSSCGTSSSSCGSSCGGGGCGGGCGGCGS